MCVHMCTKAFLFKFTNNDTPASVPVSLITVCQHALPGSKFQPLYVNIVRCSSYPNTKAASEVNSIGLQEAIYMGTV